MSTEQDIYHTIGQAVADGVTGDWTKAVLDIECLPNSKGYQGYFLTSEGRKEQLEVDPPFELDAAIDKFHSNTTEGDNRWNYLRYTLYPDQSFEVEFIWDEDFAEEMAYINATMDVPEPRRGDGLSELKDVQRARKTERLYQAIAQALLANAPAGIWQQLVLTLPQSPVYHQPLVYYQPPLRYEAEVQWAPGRREALLLLGEAEAVEALYQFTGEGEHLRWEKAQVVVLPDGQYRFRFEWAGAGEYNLPTPYYREGQVYRPPASA